VSGFGPPILNSSMRSWNWPCMSPQTVTGHFCAIVSRHVTQRSYQTYHWLDVRLVLQDFAGLSRNRSVWGRHGQWASGWWSHTFSHSLCTSLSASCLQLMRLSIQPSRVGMVAGSDAGADDSCMGSGILTSSMLVSMVGAAAGGGGVAC
jgi:hypothetical protein